MTSILSRLRMASAKRAAYNKTVFEISHMHPDVAIDLGIYRDDAEEMAFKAVYGR